jgi:uncharacterized protein with HEPN domain
LPRSAAKLLWDARDAAATVINFTASKDFNEYAADPLLSAAVERKLEIVGEALGQLRRVAPSIAARIPDLAKIIAFRNLLIHGYAAVDPARVWRIVQEDLPTLATALDALSNELE